MRTRRGFLADVGLGFTGLALGAMLHRDGVARGEIPDGKPHFAPKAKSVIWLFMMGGVSQLESFDPKPELNKYAGKTIDESPYKKAVLESPYYRKNVRDFAGTPRGLMNKLYPMQVGFKKRGESGLEISDWWPHVGDCVDDSPSSARCGRPTTITRPSCSSTPAGTSSRGSIRRSAPGSTTAWARSTTTCRSSSCWASRWATAAAASRRTGRSYLGPEHAGVPLDRRSEEPAAVRHARRHGHRGGPQRGSSNLLGELNRLAGVEYPDDPALRARIKSYELAAMQTAVPEVMDFDEGDAGDAQELYGLDNPTTADVRPAVPGGAAAGRARRALRADLPRRRRRRRLGRPRQAEGQPQRLRPRSIRPIAGLLKDLKQRGLLDDTLVVWATEFGRTPGAENADGRDHHPYGFSVWLAGGGIKGGVVHGATDELGFHAVENRHYVTDIHATVLHQLGLDPRKLEVPGRKRLEIDFGKPIAAILA